MATQWFTYSGTDPADPTNYTAEGTSAPTCSGTPQQLCAIHTENNGGEPDLESIALEMVQALQNQVNTTNVKLKSR
ncbi:hypothetical protein [Sphingobacterium sp. MYb388]|uniref:hypothetical protein n=1 Tax=Sphingobacterium sp. MYb388 TaxID=2745437 RepID=UPI0030B0A52C